MQHSGGFLGLLVIITKEKNDFIYYCTDIFVIFLSNWRRSLWLAGWLLLYVGLCSPDCLLYSTRFPSPSTEHSMDLLKLEQPFFFYPPGDYTRIDSNLTPCKIMSRKEYTGAAKVLSSPFRLLVFYMGSGERMQIIVTM